YVFFFQAEDGIRDRNVTGVQTCALPILRGFMPMLRKTLSTSSGNNGEGLLPAPREPTNPASPGAFRKTNQANSDLTTSTKKSPGKDIFIVEELTPILLL